MAYLLDTNLLARLGNTLDARHTVAAGAVLELHRRGELLHITPQVLIEFRNVATRPTGVNGLGLSAVGAEAKAAVFQATFPLLPETPTIYPAWKALVCTFRDYPITTITDRHGVFPCEWHSQA